MSSMAKRELLASIQDRYQGSSKKDKSRILDEFIAVTGHHRKHGIRLLEQPGDSGGQMPGVKGRRIYDEEVREAVILVWQASDRICGKRLKAALPQLVESMERHGHLDLDSWASFASTAARLLPLPWAWPTCSATLFFACGVPVGRGGDRQTDAGPQTTHQANNGRVAANRTRYFKDDRPHQDPI